MEDNLNEREQRVKRLILGQKRIATKRLRDDRVTRFRLRAKNRKVLDEFPPNLAYLHTPVTDLIAVETQQKDRRVLDEYIRAYSTGSADRKVVLRRRYLFGEPIITIASEEDVRYSSARSIINRFERFLGIPPKQRRR